MKSNAVAREDRERFYIAKVYELQRIWKNRIDPDFDAQQAVKELSDEYLETLISQTVSQIRFERFLGVIKWSFLGAIAAFVALGVVSLLLFGIRQLFP